MELWIRSQYKDQLTKANNLFIDGEYTSDFQICDDGVILARYKTKERAFEVLNEIQAIILYSGLTNDELKENFKRNNITICSQCEFNNITNICLYQMPEK